MIYDQLYDWQKNIVDNNLSKTTLGLWLDCGLGKSPISLAFAEKNNCDKVIVITINSKATETVDEKGSWFWWATKSKFNYKLFGKEIYKSDLEFNMDPSILLLNYESLFIKNKSNSKSVGLDIKPEIKKFIKSCYGSNVAIIIDESHKMKDLNSKQTKSINKIINLSRGYADNVYVYLLTGTPFTVGYIDLYSQLKTLGCPMTKTDFVDRFCVQANRPGLLGWQQPIIGYKNIEDLYKLIHHYALTIKSEDMIELPPKFFVYHETSMSKVFNLMTKENASGVEIEAQNRKIGITDDSYHTTKKMPNPYYRNIDYPDTKYFADTAGSMWLRCRQLSIGFQGNHDAATWFDRSRLDQLKKFLDTNRDNYIIFYNYVPEMVELYDICESLGYNIDVYSGEIKSLYYYDKYANSNESDKLTNKNNIILANFASGSTGKNWQEYNKCILFSLPLYKDWEQGLKRIHRIGQNNTVIYHIFYQDNWLDRRMLDMLDKQSTYSEDMFMSDLRKNNL